MSGRSEPSILNRVEGDTGRGKSKGRGQKAREEDGVILSSEVIGGMEN